MSRWLRAKLAEDPWWSSRSSRRGFYLLLLSGLLVLIAGICQPWRGLPALWMRAINALTYSMAGIWIGIAGSLLLARHYSRTEGAILIWAGASLVLLVTGVGVLIAFHPRSSRPLPPIQLPSSLLGGASWVP